MVRLDQMVCPLQTSMVCMCSCPHLLLFVMPKTIKRLSHGCCLVKLEGHFRLLNVDTGEQVADVFTKPFTERITWIHALKLIAPTTKTVDHAPDRKSKSAAAPASPPLTKISQEQVEEAAKILNKAGRYDFDDFEQVAEMMHDALRMSNSRLRRCIGTDDQKAPKYFVFGLWTHAGCFGITKRTQQFPNLCRYMNEFVKHHAPRSFTWSSLVVNFMGKAGAHQGGGSNWPKWTNMFSTRMALGRPKLSCPQHVFVC